MRSSENHEEEGGRRNRAEKNKIKNNTKPFSSHLSVHGTSTRVVTIKANREPLCSTHLRRGPATVLLVQKLFLLLTGGP